MRHGVIFCALLISGSAAFGQTRSAASPPPDQFEIGHRTFCDFGPPSDDYELFVVHPTVNGTSIERITLTPPVDSCTRQAKLEVASAGINESLASLIGAHKPMRDSREGGAPRTEAVQELSGIQRRRRRDRG